MNEPYQAGKFDDAPRISRKLILWAFNAVILLIVYGSLYPFHFSLNALSMQALEEFSASWTQFGGRGDILGNVVLFLPFGALGMLSLPYGRRLVPHFVFIFLIGLIVAVGVQVVQLVIPERDAVLGDVSWNMLGCTVGAVPLMSRAFRETILNSPAGANALLPLGLIACWYAAELAPFVPTIDLQAIKNALKPLLVQPNFDFLDFFDAFVAWLAIAFLITLARLRIRDWHIVIGAMLFMLFAKIIIIKNVVTVADVTAAAAAFIIWFLFLRSRPYRAYVVAILLVSFIEYSGLEPFNIRESASPFNWVPFAGSLSGSMFINVQAALGKIFLIGALLLLLLQIGFRIGPAILFSAILMTVVEIAQIWIGAHTPEITDPLLVLAIGSMIAVLRITPEKAPERHRLDDVVSVDIEETEPLAKPVAVPSTAILTLRADLLSWRRLALLVFGVLAIAVVLKIVLGLPKIPYNVRELFGGADDWGRLLLFALAVLSVGMGSALAGALTASSRVPYLVLPVVVLLSCYATYWFLDESVTDESMKDVLGAANSYRLVTTENMWGERGRRIYELIGSAKLITEIEYTVRFLAFSGSAVFLFAIFFAGYVAATMKSHLQGARFVTEYIKSTSIYLLCGLPWLLLTKIIIIDLANTDNLTELIGNYGILLYLLFALFAVNAIAIVHLSGLTGATGRIYTALFCIASLPLGWLLFKYGLLEEVHKYRLVYSGPQFLLGASRTEILPDIVLMFRWFALQISLIGVLAFGMKIMSPQYSALARADNTSKKASISV